MKSTWTKEEEMPLCMLSKTTIGTRCTLMTCRYGVSDALRNSVVTAAGSCAGGFPGVTC